MKQRWRMMRYAHLLPVINTLIHMPGSDTLASVVDGFLGAVKSLLAPSATSPCPKAHHRRSDASHRIHQYQDLDDSAHAISGKREPLGIGFG